MEILTGVTVGLGVVVAAQSVAAVGFVAAWIMARRGLFARRLIPDGCGYL